MSKIGDIVVVERLKDGGQLIETAIKRLLDLNGRRELVPESHDPKFTIIYPDAEDHGTEVKIVAKVVNAIAGGFYWLFCQKRTNTDFARCGQSECARCFTGIRPVKTALKIPINGSANRIVERLTAR